MSVVVGGATSVVLPRPGGGTVRHRPNDPGPWTRPAGPFRERIAYAAAHVAADARGANAPGAPAAVDWGATMAFRRHLWSYGFGVAEAMDTAQRGMGLDWSATRTLITRSAREARAVGGAIAAGAGTDHMPAARTLEEIRCAYAEQVAFVQDAGATVILMASRQLAAVARSPLEYHEVYAPLIEMADRPVILHWLGPMFDPALTGYWGSGDIADAADSVLTLIAQHPGRVDGIKVSLLDAALERQVRDRLPAGVRLYTGDDYNYPELIRDEGGRHSDALLGVFAAIAPAASTALQALDRGDLAGFDALGATTALARHLFAPPTQYYKTGIAFLAWLSGHQRGFTMVGGLQSGRSVLHLAEAYRLADELGLFAEPERAARRVAAFLQVAGIDQ
ncbi:DUF993 family protein [Pseudonocardia sp. GCM10023141]|uniref:DUF993 family protein n=1 Tax=Pseudonocardia sp. GCM10023141 TaxID=3252653 RepID=UPI00360A7AA6